jgi:hypothetical protein
MMRHRLVQAVVFAAVLATAPALADPGHDDIGEVPLPGGVEAARVLLRDGTTASRALFVAEFIRRFYDTPRDSDENQHPQLRALLTHLDRASRDPAAPSDTVPLPLGAEWWSRQVFGGRVGAAGVVLEILRSRDTALLYCGLLELDRPTRRWLGGEKTIVARLVRGGAAPLVAAGPGVRVAEGRFVTPGGEPVREAWERLVGASTSEPAAFLGRVLDADDGVLAYFLGRMSLVPPTDLGAVLAPAADGGRDRTASLRRLYDVFRRAAQRWKVTARPFSSLPDDPTLLLADVLVEIARGARIPGTEQFWSEVFESTEPSGLGAVDEVPGSGRAASLLWLLERVAQAGNGDARVRAAQVRFGLRVFGRPGGGTTRHRAMALSALASYPALVRALERMRLTNAEVYCAAIDRAASLRGIDDSAVQARSIGEFQGALALLARAVARGAVARERVDDLVSSLAAVPLGKSGEYRDGIARWIDSRLRPSGADHATTAPDRGIDDDVVSLLAALPSVPPSSVEWEGTRYRVDLAYGEARRMARIRGEPRPRLLDAASAIFAMADRLEHAALTRDLAHREAAALDDALRNTYPRNDEEGGGSGGAGPSAAARLLRSAANGARLSRGEPSGALRSLGEDLVASGLAELAYAAALGEGERLPLGSLEAASRHDFGIDRLGEARGALAWKLPVISVRTRGPWHMEGSLLSLDLALAEMWLRRTSDRPLDRAPTVDRGDRRALSEVVVTIDPAALRDQDLARIAAAIDAGRRRVAGLATADEAERSVATLRMSELRRQLAPWMVENEPERFRDGFSPSELLGLGAESMGLDPGTLDAWGAPVRPRVGCGCLELPRHAPDLYAGFSSSGVLTGTLPDLNLLLAERLHALQMPAALLPGVLAAATLTLVDRAPIRYPDDLRALVEQVNRLSIDDAEQYLSLLTVDGPLVPAQDEGTTRESGGQPR